MAAGQPLANGDRSARLHAGAVSLGASVVFFALKFGGYLATGSTAVLSDALESIVNVVAALFTVASLAFSARPADESHPYGHGKIEFLSSAFEGGLIAFAAVVILYQAAEALLFGVTLRSIDLGLALIAVAGIGNALLGTYLIRVGRAARSPALEADGQHVLTDFWTTVGVIVGLALVRVTGIDAVDPIVAGMVAINLAFVGAGLVRSAVGGLLDASEPKLLERLAGAIDRARIPGVVAVHRLRAIRVGGAVHVDAHLVVPRFWQVSAAHELAARFEDEVMRAVEGEAEHAFHLDPCRSLYCSGCPLDPCPVRAHPFAGRPPVTVADLTSEPPRG
jgi:cation diffusion facilitator family transporter